MWKVLSFLSLVQRDEILEFEEKTNDYDTQLNLLVASQSKKGVSSMRKEFKKQQATYRNIKEDVKPDANAMDFLKNLNKK